MEQPLNFAHLSQEELSAVKEFEQKFADKFNNKVIVLAYTNATKL